MITQKFMGRGQLINRLSAQVGSREKAVRIFAEQRTFDGGWEDAYGGREKKRQDDGRRKV